MKAKRIIFWFMFVIFSLSFALLVYAAWSIFSESYQTDRTLLEWEELLAQNIAVSIEEKLYDHLALEELVQIHPDNGGLSANVEEGDLIGKLAIPILDRELPILHGTGDTELARGVGHYIGSAFPGEQDQVVLSGHRQTVFRDLGKVQIGDQLVVETLAGTFTYEVFDQFIVDQNDRGVIVPHDEAVLTLVTCYPFQYVGSAPERYILQAKLTNY